MSLTQRLSEYISAAFTGIWIQSAEHDDALTEIAQMCRQQNWRLTAAAQNIVPVAVTAAESVERLRGWASGRCLDAEAGGIYRWDHRVAAPGRRRVSRGPSSN